MRASIPHAGQSYLRCHSPYSDVFKMGLQRTIQKAPIAMADAIVKSCIDVIIHASMGGDEFGLELLNALLINCAEAMQPQHQRLLKTLLAQVRMLSTLV